MGGLAATAPVLEGVTSEFAAGVRALGAGEGLPALNAGLGGGVRGPVPGGTKLDPTGVPLKPGSSGGPTAEKRFDKDIKALVREENRATHDGKLTCVLCGRNDLVDPPQAVGGRQQQPNEAQVDHIISRHKGGNTTQENGQVACPSCNQKKFQQERNP